MSESEIIQALGALHAGGTDSKQADKYLELFQKTENAWQIAGTLLHNADQVH
jgi:hypothetical protein